MFVGQHISRDNAPDSDPGLRSLNKHCYTYTTHITERERGGSVTRNMRTSIHLLQSVICRDMYCLFIMNEDIVKLKVQVHSTTKPSQIHVKLVLSLSGSKSIKLRIKSCKPKQLSNFTYFP